MQRPGSVNPGSADVPSGDTTESSTSRPEASPGGGQQPPWWHLCTWWLVSLVVAVLHNGLWATPNLGFMAHIAQNPGTNPFPPSLPGDYLLTGLSMPTIATLLGQTAPHEVARLHLAALIAGWAGVVALARLRFGHVAARNLTVLIAAAPVTTASMQWLGQPDPVTAMCGVAMVIVRRRWAVFALGVLAGLTHPEQAVFMAIVAGVTRALLPVEPEHPIQPWWRTTTLGVLSALGGVVVGRLVTQVWFWVSDIDIAVPRSDYIDSGLATFWAHHTQQVGALLWSLWGPIWIVALTVALAAVLGGLAPRGDRDAKRATGAAPGPRAAAWAMVGVAVVMLLPVFVTLDETRVYAVLTAPLLGGGAIWLARVVPERAALVGASVLLLLTALLPGVMATGTSSTRADLDTVAMMSFLRDGSVPAAYQDPEEGPMMTEWLLEPFDIVIDDPGS